MTYQHALAVLSFNIWGAPYAQHRKARMRLIGKKIAELQPDVVLLQEVYMQNNRDDLLARLTSGGYEHFHYYASGLVGSGLLTVSKYPIIETHFLRYRMGGKPLMLKQGDFYAGKGIGMARLNIDNVIVDVYNIHPHAQYEMHHNNEYGVYTNTNLYEATQFIRAYSANNPIIVGGDFNTRPDQLGYRIMLTLADLEDTANILHEDGESTFSTKNAYVTSENQRLDYIMIRSSGAIALLPTTYAIKMDEVLKFQRDGALQYSDHYGVWSELVIEDAEGTTNNGQDELHAKQEILRQLHADLTNALVDTTLAQGSNQSRAIMSIVAVGDLWIATRILKRFAPQVIRHIRHSGTIIAMVISLYFLLQARVNLEARRQTIEHLRDEILWQLNESA